ncbi:MAG: TolC family protein, partial [Puniceicoccales bacterium]|nr:TolC family protein [Puniceicoccales bacterium]
KKIAEAEWQEARLKASQEIWTAYHAVQSARKQLRAAEACREAAGESFEATQVAYQNGLASFSDLVSAQNALAGARQQQVQSENAAYVALANLGYATGGIVVGEAGPHPLCYVHEM